MKPIFKPRDVLDLTLEGSIGTFQVAVAGTPLNRSTEVVFLETHVGFDLRIDSNDKLLRYLAPVREIFPFELLGFDEIMQRDIDDARVSTELIPYLLDAKARGTVKFFPPIVIVVLPVKDQSALPDTKYPKVTTKEEDHPDHKTPFKFIRAGAVGMEAFEFEYPLYEGRPRRHDFVRLKLNTSKVKLVIIDGQHRAMALLALYRNLMLDWNQERRMPYKDYYAEWTKARIAGFNLNNLQLPIIVCTFPEIDTDYNGDLTLIEAARRMFLTLNESARKVSKSRNLLLDDQDLVSHFMRDTLRTIKQRDLHAKSSLRIWNVELDQYGDRQVIESPMACTGVTHCYYLIEHMLFDDGDVKGIGARSGKFSARKGSKMTENLVDRLDGENILGMAVAGSLRRDDYTKEAAERLGESFMGRYGAWMVAAFDSFLPFEIHNKTALETEASLKGNKNPQIKTILFDGQNIWRTFRNYRDHMHGLAKQAKLNGTVVPAEIQAIIDQLDGTNNAVDETVKAFKAARLVNYLDGFGEKGKLRTEKGDFSAKIRAPIDRLYDDVYFTVAFQAALVCGFFQIMERAEREAGGKGEQTMSRQAALTEYIQTLNGFFVPPTMSRLKHLLRAFFYDVKEDRAEEWKEVRTGESFYEVIFRGEMKPDEWPKYRIIFLELWEPSDKFVKEARDAELDDCRQQAFRSLRDKKMRDFCVANKKDERDLIRADWDEIFKEAFASFDGFFSHLVSNAAKRFSQTAAKKALSKTGSEGPSPEAGGAAPQAAEAESAGDTTV